MPKKRAYIREQKHACGDDWMEVDFFRVTEQEHRASLRAKKEKASSIMQQFRNERHSRRYLNQLVCTNFNENDILLTLTYKRKYQPQSLDEARRNFRNYVRRINTHRKAKGLGPMEYIEVTEYSGHGVLHHHVITRGDMSRGEYEEKWRVGRGKPEDRPSLGLTNTEPLQFDETGIAGLVHYLTKNPQRKRRWSQSRGLKKPEPKPPNDSKYSRLSLHRACTSHIDDAAHWEKKYPGWRFMKAEAQYTDENGWYLYIRLRKPSANKKRRKDE